MSREALDRAVTLKALIQAGESAVVSNSVYDTEASNTISLEQFAGAALSSSDMIWDNGGDDRINSGSGADWLIAGTGADAYNGGIGFDMLAYVRANTGVKVDMNNEDGSSFFRELNTSSFAYGDTMKNIEGVIGSRHDDSIRGFTDGKNSYINGFEGNDTLIGGRGSDVMKGGLGDDVITIINGGRDEVFGGADNDRFTVGGSATITGGTGVDTFVFIVPAILEANGRILGEVVITDYDSREDRFIFQGIDESDVNMTADGNDTILTIDGVNGSIRLLDAEF